MITEYIKGNPTTIYDTNRGLYQTEYYDNLENIIQKENEIEIIKEKIKTLEEFKNTIQIYSPIEYKKDSLAILASFLISIIIFTTYLGIFHQHIIFFITALLTSTGVITYCWLPIRKNYKKAKKKIEALIEAIPELEKEQQQKETELLKLKNESKKQEPIEVKIDMASFNQTYRQELEAKLNELMASKCNDKGVSLGLSFKKPNN